MIFLEIAMILIGLAAILYSVRVSDKKEINSELTVPMVSSEEQRQTEQRQLEEMLHTFKQSAEEVSEELDDRMSLLSNEKIMGINEFSEQVIEKIEKNHEEVVFLYDMMNEKQEEMKKLIHDIDSVKADWHDETAKEYQRMKELQKEFDDLKQAVELEMIQFQSEKKSDLSFTFDDMEVPGDFDELLEYKPVSTQKEAQQAEFAHEEAPVAEAISVYDAEIARIEAEEAKAQADSSVYAEDDLKMDELPTSSDIGVFMEKSSEENKNHNDEIISLYKKGRSILEISKMLSLGQGEVKFVIDLHNAR